MAVIGGGINGVAIARECARGGRTVLLVEQNDFAGGTTSRSTRIIHGGLRYLEHGELGLVRESLRERERLLRERRHLVRPMQFVLALPPGRRSALEIRLGLWLYRKCAGAPPRECPVDSLERMLDRGGDLRRLRLFTYDDAQCEFPERLTAEWLTEATVAGATVRNHTRALEIELSDGRVRGLRLRDLLDSSEYRVTAAQVVNASGPWADSVCQASGIHTGAQMIGGIRGSHIVLPRFPGAPASALYTEAVDGRPVFLVPWNGELLFGTTEVRDGGDPGRTQPSSQEIQYLMTSLHRLFPQAPLGEVRYAFAGIRPLPNAPQKTASAVTRRHLLRDHAGDGAAGLISVIGGKLTTAASLARECARKLGVNVPEPQNFGIADASGVEEALSRVVAAVAVRGHLGKEVAAAVVGWHGRAADSIARIAASDGALAQPILEGSEHIVAETAYAVQYESAVTLADILLRRVPVALSGEWNRDTTRQAARRIGAALGWNEMRVRMEEEAFEHERNAFLISPTAVRLPMSA